MFPAHLRRASAGLKGLTGYSSLCTLSRVKTYQLTLTLAETHVYVRLHAHTHTHMWPQVCLSHLRGQRILCLWGEQLSHYFYSVSIFSSHLSHRKPSCPTGSITQHQESEHVSHVGRQLRRASALGGPVECLISVPLCRDGEAWTESIFL